MYYFSFYYHLAYIGHPAYKKMGARQAYSAINCLIYLPLCFFGIIGIFLRIIAVVAVNPVIVSYILYLIYHPEKNKIERKIFSNFL